MVGINPQHERLLRAMYDAFNARDIDAALAGSHPDVDWPNAFEGGRVRGHDAVRAYWTRQWAQVDPRVELLDLNTDDVGRIVALVHLVVRDMAGTLIVDQILQHVYSMNEGLVQRMDVW